MTIEERLAELENKFAAMSVAQQAAGDPSGYYTSIYSGEQIDAAIGGVLEGNIPNLSGSTIPVSPSDQTSIAAALSKKADATPPEEYDLPLVDGVTAKEPASYCKSQEGIVFVSGWVQGAAMSMTVATLPAGYRPQRVRQFAVPQSTAAGKNETARIEIYSSGAIMLIATSNEETLANGLSLCCSFVAAN